ncbi:raffinose/stachyose/melibiose transport system permease protein [Microbacterium immunditiarum]|uniref:Raffinose/stachyose/melibiose transport system permease protein n=1 Tax=Microbacterium immunditiarum TaxID=337480 RepID=A0A7Y9GKB4_9MICO|nr:raffinose/stachyose/melibiose transport system permease protein [Microbacterium immunditiarum]
MVLSATALVVAIVVFVVPFLFILLTSSKDRADASRLEFAFPEQFQFFENMIAVLQTRDWMLVRAFVNSTVLTVVSVALMVVFAAMVGFVLQRRRSRLNGLINAMVIAGLIIPPAIVPTIWVLQGLGLYATLPGLILIEVAYSLSFCIVLYRAFISTIPKELDEAAILDGATGLQLFFRVILPLLKPVTVTVIVVNTVAVFNDFTNPLYYLPGDANATVQLTLYNFQSEFSTSWNYLFMDILLITIPPLIVFLLFNRQIVAGMTAGAVKG